MIRHILLAEDDRATLILVKTQLEKKGYLVYPAANGIEALKVLGGRTVDLIITDVIMPKMDGVDLYAAVKRNPATANIPIIIVTDKEVFIKSFTSLGVSHFVAKSSDITQLLDRIKHVDKAAQEALKYHKILLTGNHQVVLDQMNEALKGHHYLTAAVSTTQEILAQALAMTPHAILIDVSFQDNGASHEIISALRCFSSLQLTKIITYAYFSDELGMDVEGVLAMEHAIERCQEAGTDKYIGRFNQAFFLERMMELGI